MSLDTSRGAVHSVIDPMYGATETSAPLLAFGLVMVLLGRWWRIARRKRSVKEIQGATLRLLVNAGLPLVLPPTKRSSRNETSQDSREEGR